MRPRRPRPPAQGAMNCAPTMHAERLGGGCEGAAREAVGSGNGAFVVLIPICRVFGDIAADAIGFLVVAEDPLVVVSLPTEAGVDRGPHEPAGRRLPMADDRPEGGD